jgi:hypothetical protein
MEPFEPRYVDLPDGGRIRLCGLAYCTQPLYARREGKYAVCKGHYVQLVQGKEPAPLFHYWELEHPPCSFPGCRNVSLRLTGDYIYCQGHTNQVYAGKELTPLRWYTNAGYTENGRVCKSCKEEKPIDEFYDRNQWRIMADGKPGASKATQCKECFKVDVAYHQGKRSTKADGSDPRGWLTNPEAMLERRLEVNRVKVIAAKYTDYCRYCNEEVKIGAMIVWVKKDKLFHYGCYLDAARNKANLL